MVSVLIMAVRTMMADPTRAQPATLRGSAVVDGVRTAIPVQPSAQALACFVRRVRVEELAHPPQNPLASFLAAATAFVFRTHYLILVMAHHPPRACSRCAPQP
jgi:hypothetical protein